MRALMQDHPLTLGIVRERASLTPGRAVATTSATGVVSTTYGGVLARAEQVASAFDACGVSAGARIATFCWNSAEHLAFYLAVPCSGRVLHTVNVRLHPDQVGYILRDAGDEIVVVDANLFEDLARVDLPECVRIVIVVEDPADSMPERWPARLGSADVFTLRNFLGTATLGPYTWPTLNESDAAGLCYTSGTTGNPKAVVYSHRSTYLHALTLTTVDAFAIGQSDVCLPVVPMFHANAWGVPYAALIAGAALAFPGRFTDPVSLQRLMSETGTTFAAAVPTVWIALAEAIRSHMVDPSCLNTVDRMVVGGSAVTQSLLDDYDSWGAPLLHAWGMTECSPVGLIARPIQGMSTEEVAAARMMQGRPMPGLEFRLVNDDGRVQPHDGAAIGELEASGPWIAKGYYESTPSGPSDQFVVDRGRTWLRTGDVAVIDRWGFVRLVDRSKDLIKSGGEWISTVDLENALMSHPGIVEAAVVATPDEKWGERPVAWVVRTDPVVTVEDIRRHLLGLFAKWQVPETVTFVDEVPKTSVGKFDKKLIRAMLDSGHSE